MTKQCHQLTFDEKHQINKAIKYAKGMVNFKYSLWKPSMGFPKEDNSPFWKLNKPTPNISLLKKKGMCCTGLTNLVRRHLNLRVPGGRSIYVGTTSAWYNYLRAKKRLQKINFSKQYPKGTLLIQNFNPKDQGHVGILVNSSIKGILESKMIHAISDRIEGKKYNSVVIEKVKSYPKFKRYTHICLPKDWLIKN